MFSKWLQNDLGISWNLILFHLIPNEPCIPNYSLIGHLVLHGLQMASVWDETWYSSISTQMHPAYQISDHLDHWYRFWNLGNICIGRKTSHAHPPFLRRRAVCFNYVPISGRKSTLQQAHLCLLCTWLWVTLAGSHPSLFSPKKTW